MCISAYTHTHVTSKRTITHEKENIKIYIHAKIVYHYTKSILEHSIGETYHNIISNNILQFIQSGLYGIYHGSYARCSLLPCCQCGMFSFIDSRCWVPVTQCLWNYITIVELVIHGEEAIFAQSFSLQLLVLQAISYSAVNLAHFMNTKVTVSLGKKGMSQPISLEMISATYLQKS